LRKPNVDWGATGQRLGGHPPSLTAGWLRPADATFETLRLQADAASGLPREEIMAPLLIGYARVSTDGQDLTAQRDALSRLGVSAERTYVDHGLTGTNRERPGLREALAACRAGDTLVVAKLDRLARSLPDAREILEDLTRREIKLSIGGSIHDPTDPVGRLLFNVLAMVAEFESASSAYAPKRACA